MSITVMNLVWQAAIPGPASRKAVLLRLASHAHDEGGNAYPSVPSLAAASGMSRRTAATALRDLEQLGAIILIGSGAGGRSATRHYQIDLKRLQELQPNKAASPATFRPEKAANSAQKAAKIAQKAASLAAETLEPSEPSIDSCDRPLEPFDDFWRTFPSRRPHPNPKKTARQKFDAAVKRGVPAADIIRGAGNFAKYVARERIEPKFIVQAATWLNQERWTEYQVEPEPAKAAAAGWL